MTGTSLDGLDAALVEVEGVGLSMRAKFVRGVSLGLGEVGMRLRHLAEQHPMRAHEIAALMHDFAELHSASILDLLAGERCDLVCVHGQTVFHKPPLSWQLMQPATIARAVGAPVVYDLRQADLAAGGQGAPITPLADWILFRRLEDPCTVVNLGGFSNYTAWFTDLSPEEEFPGPYGSVLDIRGGDICVCNQLLDRLAMRRLGCAFDEDGRAAAGGVADVAAQRDLESLLQGQSGAARSLGTGDELEAWLAASDALPGNVALRTACEAIASTIVRRTDTLTALLLAGGGVHNLALVGAIRARSQTSVRTTDEFGVPGAYREAACFAVLGVLCQDRVPITLPGVTGCVSPAPLSGAWVYA